MLNGRLNISSLPDTVQRVLDVRTGTGQWATEFADPYPSAQVSGTDLSLIQPERKLPNCSFSIKNAEDDWDFDDEYDFIHSRLPVMGIHD